MSKAVQVLQNLLSNTSNPTILKQIIAPDATYISLTFNNPDLTAVMPWAGTHASAGPDAVIKTFKDVAYFWETLAFEPTNTFGDESQAATFGSFTYKSRKLQQTVTSPFAVYIKLNADGLISDMRFMEDTLATTASFRKSGEWVIESDPDGKAFEIPLKK